MCRDVVPAIAGGMLSGGALVGLVWWLSSVVSVPSYMLKRQARRVLAAQQVRQYRGAKSASRVSSKH